MPGSLPGTLLQLKRSSGDDAKGPYIIFSKSMEIVLCGCQADSSRGWRGGGVGGWSFLLQKLNEKKKQERKDTAAPRLVEEKVYCR